MDFSCNGSEGAAGIIFITQMDETLQFADFKTKLGSYENTEGISTSVAEERYEGLGAP